MDQGYRLISDILFQDNLGHTSSDPSKFPSTEILHPGRKIQTTRQPQPSLQVIMVRARGLHFLQGVVIQLPREFHVLFLWGSIEESQTNRTFCQCQKHRHGLVSWRWPGNQLCLQGIRRCACCQGSQVRSEGQSSMDHGDMNVILVNQDTSFVPGNKMSPCQGSLFSTWPINSTDTALIEHGVVIAYELDGMASQMFTSLQLRRQSTSITTFIPPGLG